MKREEDPEKDTGNLFKIKDMSNS